MSTSSSTRSIGCWRSRVSASGPFATTCTRWPARVVRRLGIRRLAGLSSTARIFPVSVFGAGATAIRAVSESAIGASGGALTPSAIMVCKVCAALAIRSRSWPTSAAAVCWACALRPSASALMELMGPDAAALRRRLESPRCLQAIDPRQSHVHQDQRRCIRLSHGYAGLAIDGRHDLVPSLAQAPRQHIAVELVVLDQQDLLHASVPGVTVLLMRSSGL